MRQLLTKSLIIVIGFLCVVQVSHAHRFYAAFTQIDFREKKQTIEVIHRLFTHDVEDVLRVELGSTANLTDEEIEPILKKFVESSFAIFDKEGKRLPLTWIGMEYETDSVHIYQEAKLPDDPSKLTLINKLFMALFQDQKNTVNVEWGDKIRTHIFIKGKEQQTVSFVQDKK